MNVTQEMVELAVRVIEELGQSQKTPAYQLALKSMSVDDTNLLMSFGLAMIPFLAQSDDQPQAVALFIKAIWYRGYCAGQSARDEESEERP